MWSQVLGTLAGVAFGGGIAFYATYANERAKWQRSQAIRWDERRLTAYVEYLNSIRKMQVLSNRIAVARNQIADFEPLDVDAGIPLLAEAELERSSRWQAVLLLGGASTIGVGNELNRCTWTIEWFARGKIVDAQDWRLASSEGYRLRRQFIAEARKDMGVLSAATQAPDWHPDWSPEQLLSSLRQRAQPDN